MRSAAAAAVRERDKINESAKDGLNSFVSFFKSAMQARIFTIVWLNCVFAIPFLDSLWWVLEFQAHVDPTIFIGCFWTRGFSGRYKLRAILL